MQLIGLGKQQLVVGRAEPVAPNAVQADVVNAGVDIELNPFVLQVTLKRLVALGLAGALDFRGFGDELGQLGQAQEVVVQQLIQNGLLANVQIIDAAVVGVNGLVNVLADPGAGECDQDEAQEGDRLPFEAEVHRSATEGSELEV
ncbi:MAG: hypothetical protein NZ728_02650 [Oleiphilaceae bacterium]|nr:hypothetical protein [Oleiphilaceae bacterium]